MCGRAVFSEGDAARPTTASQPPGAHDRLASITGQGWRGRISLERVLVDRDGPAIAGSPKRRVRCIGCSARFSAAVALGFPKTLPLNHGFSLSKQKADNASDNGVENRTDHHAAHSAEQHEDVGLTKQHPDHQSANEGAEDAGDREGPGVPDVPSLTHVCAAVDVAATQPNL